MHTGEISLEMGGEDNSAVPNKPLTEPDLTHVSTISIFFLIFGIFQFL